MSRQRNLARVHHIARAIKLDPQGDDYRTWLKKLTGKASCKDLDDEALAALVESLKPSEKQWQMVRSLAEQLGFYDFQDPGFKSFVRRVCKVDDAYLLEKPEVARLIAGLKGFVASRRKQASASAAVPHNEKAQTVASGLGLDVSAERGNLEAVAGDLGGSPA
jgi:hypothetical protein